MPKQAAEMVVIDMEGWQQNISKAITCLYSPTPIPLDNYYQCYDEYDEDDDDITIITSNLEKNKFENSGGIRRGIKAKNMWNVDKHSGAEGQDPYVYLYNTHKRQIFDLR